MFSYPLVRAAEGRAARVRRDRRLPGRRRPPQRAAGKRRYGAAAASVRIRHRQLLFDARRRRVWRTRVHASRRPARRAASGGDQPPRLAERLRRRSLDRRLALVIEGHPFTVVGVAPPGFFGETLRGDPPDLWIPLQQEPLINGGNGAAASAGLRVASRHRPAASRRHDRRNGAAPDRAFFAAGCRTTPAIRRTGCPTSFACCRSRSSTSCRPAPASA